jgi:hypothetical protein
MRKATVEHEMELRAQVWLNWFEAEGFGLPWTD